jgi:hypothetical protein
MRMSGCSTDGDPAESHSPIHSGPDSAPREMRNPASTGLDSTRAAAQSLLRVGLILGWGLFALGLLAALGYGLEPADHVRTTPTPWLRVAISAMCWPVALGLAGWASAIFCRLLGALIVDHAERTTRATDEFIAYAANAADALARVCRALESSGGPSARREPPGTDRDQVLADIERTLQSAEPAEAESLLDRFATRFPEDPALPGLKEHLVSRKRQAVERKLADLEAARQVLDPARVLELYQVVAPLLEPPARSALEGDLARWFVSVIHRRLRTAKIQAEVVVLATQVSEIFGATAEGASVRASLPTLRRSVGLCPRCAQPYVGSAAACPRCLSRGSNVEPAPGPLEAPS